MSAHRTTGQKLALEIFGLLNLGPDATLADATARVEQVAAIIDREWAFRATPEQIVALALQYTGAYYIVPEKAHAQRARVMSEATKAVEILLTK